ncbi:MAG: IS3 family transposase, partial [bacterium]|nr:IS3 family transposase [bacterium]
MAERLFSAEDQEKLLLNKNVIKVGETSITFCPEFKVEAVRANVIGGKPPHLVFLDAGFDLDIIGRENPKRCLERWRPIFEKRGEDGLRNDRRGKNSTGRPTDRELTIEEQLRRAEAKVRYLEKGNELLKKFDGIERRVDDRPSRKYSLIHSLIEAKEQGFNVTYLCEVAGVSRSGYYKWLSCALKRAQKEQADFEQHLLIQDIFLRKHRKAGWRVIKMELERQSVCMNHKKIRRLMREYGLITQIRRMNPYKQMAKATQEHRTLPNVLDRNFTQETPYRAFGTDITYLRDGNGQRSYLSVLRDIASGEVVSHYVSSSLGMDLSLELLKQAVNTLGEKTLNGALIHSDQGFHYTHPFYIKNLAKLGIVQSMSRKGNCIDNAPVESFFG